MALPVKVKTITHRCCELTTKGAHRGNVLSPLLFNIFINDTMMSLMKTMFQFYKKSVTICTFIYVTNFNFNAQ